MITTDQTRPTRPHIFDGVRHGAGLIDGTAFHFRTVEAAGAFVIGFPDLELADYMTGPSYTPPLRSASSIDRPAAPPKIPW